jgi:site-specific recombinase XerD
VARSARSEGRDYTPWHAVEFDPNASLDDAFEDFMDESAAVLVKGTGDKYRRDYQTFRSWLTETGRPITVAALANRGLLAEYKIYLETRPNRKPGRAGRKVLATYTVHSYMRLLRTFARLLVSEGRLPRDPFFGPRSPMPRLPRAVDKAATKEQVDALWSGTEGATPLAIRNRMIITLVVDTGIRTGEVARLQLGDLHEPERYIFIRKSKFGEQRVVPADDLAFAAIRRYLRSSRPRLARVDPAATRPEDILVVSARHESMTPSGILQAVTDAYAAGGGDTSLGLHALRHGWAQNAADKGMPIDVAQTILGHANIATTRGYYTKPSLAHMQSELARLDPSSQLPRGRRVARRRLAAGGRPDPSARQPVGRERVGDDLTEPGLVERSGLIRALQELADLRERAMLSDEEFKLAKSRLLAG